MDEFRKYINSDAEIKFVPHGEKLASFETELVKFCLDFFQILLTF